MAESRAIPSPLYASPLQARQNPPVCPAWDRCPCLRHRMTQCQATNRIRHSRIIRPEVTELLRPLRLVVRLDESVEIKMTLNPIALASSIRGRQPRSLEPRSPFPSAEREETVPGCGSRAQPINYHMRRRSPLRHAPSGTGISRHQNFKLTGIDRGSYRPRPALLFAPPPRFRRAALWRAIVRRTFRRFLDQHSALSASLDKGETPP